MFVVKSSLKRIGKAGALAVLFSSMPFVGGYAADAKQADVNSIHYAQESWAPELFQAIKNGPVILSRDHVFEVEIPALNDSEITRVELDYLLDLEKYERNQNNIGRILLENEPKKAYELFENEGLLNSENYKVIDFLQLTDYDHRYFILERKKHFERARPNQLEASLELIIPNPPHAAYPSGHASQTYMVALILSDFDPENAQYYKQFAYDIAHRREIAGVHYPSDSIAGRKLAVDVLMALRDVEIYEKKYQEAKASYVKPKSFAIEKFKTYLAERPKEIEKLPALQAEWQEIGIELQ